MSKHTYAAEAATLPYAFAVGQSVDHVAGGMPAIISARSRTALGAELYELSVASGSRTFLGAYLKVA